MKLKNLSRRKKLSNQKLNYGKHSLAEEAMEKDEIGWANWSET